MSSLRLSLFDKAARSPINAREKGRNVNHLISTHKRKYSFKNAYLKKTQLRFDLIKKMNEFL